jgi:hypothetical protein
MDLGGRSLIGRHVSSLHELLSVAYPGHKWEPHLFALSSLKKWEEILRGGILTSFLYL